MQGNRKNKGIVGRDEMAVVRYLEDESTVMGAYESSAESKRD